MPSLLMMLFWLSIWFGQPVSAQTCASETALSACTIYTQTLGNGSSAYWDCGCVAGRYGFPICDLCPLDAYCPFNASAPVPCPASVVELDPSLQFYTSQIGSTSFAQCQCPSFATQVGQTCVRCAASNYVLNNTCLVCPSQSFCPGDGLAWPCNRWSLCPTGTAGVGVVCLNNSFFEPHLLLSSSSTNTLNASSSSSSLVQSGDYQVTAVAVYERSSDGVTVVLGADGQCSVTEWPLVTRVLQGDAAGGAVIPQALIASVPAALFGVPAGACPFGVGALLATPGGAVWVGVSRRTLRVWLNNTLRTVLNETQCANVSGPVLAYAPDSGLVFAACGARLWAINPSTLAQVRVSSRAALGGANVLSLAYLELNSGLSALVVGTDSYEVYILPSQNLSAVSAVFLTPSQPRALVYAGSVMYGDGNRLYQLTGGGQWVDFLSLNLGVHYYAEDVVPANFNAMDWENGLLWFASATGLWVMGMCTPCPDNSTVLSPSVLGFGRCACISGLYMDLTRCAPCPPGHYCPGPGALAPTLCPLGAYCPGGRLSAPIPCLASVYCAPGAFDALGHVVGGSEQVLCEPGYYRTSVACVACPALSTTNGTGATSIQECVCGLTGDGLYTYLNLTKCGCSVCPATFACPLGTTAPALCPPRTYCPQGVNAPRACPAGYYCPGGVPEPLPCPAGTLCVPNSAAWAGCPATFFCPATTLQALPCPAGRFCPTASGGPLACPAGWYCPASAAAPTVCPSNAYCPGNVSAPIPCPLATLSLSGAGAAQQCFCASNYYGPGGALCLPCPVGAVSAPDSLNLSYCGCLAGFKLGPDASACVACANTEYCPAGITRPCPAGLVCTPSSASLCPAGSYCPAGSTAPTPCPPGFVCVEGCAWPLPCPAGYYCPNSTAVPLACPAGSYCTANASRPIPCPGGYQCATGSSVWDAVPCSAGRFCPAGTGAAGLICTPGGYCPQGVSIPLVCPPGKYCGAGDASPEACPPGRYCPIGSFDPLLCPPGYYCPVFEISVPYLCPPNNYCLEGVENPTPCPSNSSALNGSAALTACLCDPGFSAAAVDNQTCAACAPGSYSPVSGSAVCLACSTATGYAADACPLSSSALWVAVGASIGSVALLGGGFYALVATHVVVLTPLLLGEARPSEAAVHQYSRLENSQRLFQGVSLASRFKVDEKNV